MVILWLALATFAIGTEAFVISGLLSVMSSDLGISLAATGQLVTAYALIYAMGSPVLAVAFNNLDRRTVLTLALGCFIASNILAVLATGFATLLAARMLMAIGAGLCTPTALAVAAATSAPERRGRAMAWVTSGLTISTVLGVPLGTWIGGLYGWRATYILVAVLGTIALAGLLFGLPRGLPRDTATLGQRLAIARHSAILHALLVTAFWAIGAFAVLTYLAIPLRNLGLSPTEVSLGLLVFGVAAAIGNMVGGTLADRIGPIPTVTLGLITMMLAVTLESVVLKVMAPDSARAIFLGLVFFQGFGAFIFYPGQTANLVRIEPQAAMIALSLNASAMYFGFALGGAVLTAMSPTDLGWVGGTSIATAVAAVLLRGRQMRLQTA